MADVEEVDALFFSEKQAADGDTRTGIRDRGYVYTVSALLQGGERFAMGSPDADGGRLVLL